ncbi:MAG: PQQ-dependent sugar dehydrogenase [Acidobacteria bacterium]|nr:PQQ-dependent sugar dehydrogenase [Acidobacteriota bacterium]MBI3278971.1 PQQ-dependent sugar dehydrogenase [Acidobacteriota bacterium]
MSKLVLVCGLVLFAWIAGAAPTMLVPNLTVNLYQGGLALPTTMAFIGANEFFVLEKNSGKVKHVINGNVHEVLDLAVNSSSERGLLGVALHPNFGTNHFVYLYWSCRAPVSADPFMPSQTRCVETPELGADTNDVLATPLLGNRVDRFVWNGSTLMFDRNLIMLRAFQNDGATSPLNPVTGQMQPPRANHDGGVIAFGPDAKLYIIIGDVGRRSRLQNLPSGPTPTGLGATVPDDQFGGPQPDDAHFTGVIIRLNDDGSTPVDNPFYSHGAGIGGEVGRNIQKIFAYGIRNSFGMTFDPLSGNLWAQENGEDAFDELNLVEPGMNSGWIQIAGPVARVAQYRQIETTSLHHEDFPNLQQFRWSPENIAQTPGEALSRLFALPGSHYSDPEFSWKFVIAPAGLGFLNSRALGPQFFGDLFMGLSTTDTLGGALLRIHLTGNRRKVAVDNSGLEDRVDDNTDVHELTESAGFLVGRDFGIVTDIKTGPDGNLYVVSLSQGAIYRITRRP